MLRFFLITGLLGPLIATSQIDSLQKEKDLIVYKALLKPLTDRQNELVAYVRAASHEEQKSEKLIADYKTKSYQLMDETRAMRKKFVKDHPNSLVSLDLVKILAGAAPRVADAELLFNSLSPEVRNSTPGKEYEMMIEKWKRVETGNTAPGFAQKDVNGKLVSLEDFKGKYVLIDFWASWCSPCRAENPNVVAAFNKFNDRGFTVLGISLDKDNDKWIDAINADHLTWTQLSDLKYWNNEVATLYGIRSIPQNFLIDPQGKIIAKNLRGEELNKKLEELLKQRIYSPPKTAFPLN